MCCSIFCRSQNLLKTETFKDTTTVNDLDFSAFMTLIIRELNYQKDEDVIMYECKRVMNMCITNE